MSGSSLDIKTNAELTALLVPLCGSSPERRTLLWNSFRDHLLAREVNTEGNTDTFVATLLRTLHNYGDIERQPALIHLLKNGVWPKYGTDKQKEITRLCEHLETVVRATDAHPSYFTLSHSRNADFTGRTETLNRIANIFENGGRGIVAVSGLGGMGKTSVAVEYAYQNRSLYQAVFWMRAENESDITTGMIVIGKFLGIPDIDRMTPDEAIPIVLAELNSPEDWNRPLLMILDNLDEDKLLPMLAEVLPHEAHVRILITSRLETFSIPGRGRPDILPLSRLSQTEAETFLLRRTGKGADGSLSLNERTAMSWLANELGGLPLALEQAAAYLFEQTAMTFVDYKSTYERRKLSLFARPDARPLNYDKTILTTWTINFEQIEGTLAESLLYSAAFFDSEDIPIDACFAVALVNDSTHNPGNAKDLDAVWTEAEAEGDPLRLKELLKTLTRYSLLKYDPERDILSMHKLTQEVARHRLDERLT